MSAPLQLLVRGTRLGPGPELSDLHVRDGRFADVLPHVPEAAPPEAAVSIEAAGAYVSPPFVEPHIHLDATLTAGEPRWNSSGTLWEGIAVWSERKSSVTREDVLDRAEQVLRWQAAQGVLHVRTHCDVTDPRLHALDALLELRERVRDVVGLQIVAFPQKGSSPSRGARSCWPRRSAVGWTSSAPSHTSRTRARTASGPWRSPSTSPSGTAGWSTPTATRSTTSSPASSRCWRPWRCAGSWGSG